MEARSIPFPLAAPGAAGVSGARAGARAVPWPLAATLFAATSIVVGLIWDISWHMTIGRDTFWTPAHLGIYLGGTLAGVANGLLVLHTTLRGSAGARARSVRFWGLRGPLGAFASVWGAGAMLTSAPFDDWWHNAYGLDVEILSPPHVVLLLGIFFVIGGACLTALQAQNAAEAEGDPRAGTFRAAFAYAMGLLLTMGALAVWSQTRPIDARFPFYYQYAAVPLTFVLAAALRGLRGRWPATTVALVYMAVLLAMGWALWPWPAAPRLGPIRQDTTHMVPLGFPLLLAAPAFAMDLLARRLDPAAGAGRRWLHAAALGLGFLAVFAAVQLPLSAFLMSGAGRNALFLEGRFPYMMPMSSEWVRGVFPAYWGTRAEYVRGMLWAALCAVLSARLGLAWGAWMRGVRR
jgi:hypothetical protein